VLVYCRRSSLCAPAVSVPPFYMLREREREREREGTKHGPLEQLPSSKFTVQYPSAVIVTIYSSRSRTLLIACVVRQGDCGGLNVSDGTVIAEDRMCRTAG
jgi:hypothetical protein